jgi:hypothetical protein
LRDEGRGVTNVFRYIKAAVRKKEDGLAFFYLTQTLPKGVKIFIIISKINNFSHFLASFFYQASLWGIFDVGVKIVVLRVKVFSN